MASLLSWLGSGAKRVANTVNNDVIHPIQRDVAHPVANAAAAVAHGVNPLDNGQGYTTRPVAPQRVPQPVQQAIQHAKYGPLVNNPALQNSLLNRPAPHFNPVTATLSSAAMAPYQVGKQLASSTVDTAQIPYSAGRLAAATITHNVKAANNARVAVGNDANNSYLGYMKPVGNELGGTIYAKSGALDRQVAKIQSNDRNTVAQHYGTSPQAKAYGDLLASADANQVYNSQLNQVGLTPNSSKLRTAVTLGAPIANAAVQSALLVAGAESLGATKGMTAAQKAVYAAKNPAEKTALKYGTANAGSAVLSTAANLNATPGDYVKNAVTAFGAGAALPMAGKAVPVISKGAKAGGKAYVDTAGKLVQDTHPAIQEIDNQYSQLNKQFNNTTDVTARRQITQAIKANRQTRAQLVKQVGSVGGNVPANGPTDPLAGLKQEAETLYHGGNHPISEFEISKAHPSGLYGKAIYLTKDANRAKSYGPNVSELKLPADAKLVSSKEFEKRVSEITPTVQYGDPTVARAQAIEQLKNEGYHGVREVNKQNGDTVAIFDPSILRKNDPLSQLKQEALKYGSADELHAAIQKASETAPGHWNKDRTAWQVGFPKNKLTANEQRLRDLTVSNDPTVIPPTTQAFRDWATTQGHTDPKAAIADLYNQAHTEAKTPAKIILKEGPVRGGRQDVITAQRDPQTGHLVTKQESIVAPKAAKLSTPDEIGHALGMSDAELASLESRTPLQERLGAPQEASPRAEGQPGAATPALHNPSSDSFDSGIPNIAEEVKGHPSYPIEKKVNILDYLRTPDRVLQKLGMAKEAQNLRAADHAYKTELPKQIDRIKQWRDAVGNSPEASQRIFKYLDGQKTDLSPVEHKVAGEMKAALNEWADRLGIPDQHRISNYITHIFDESLVGKEFDPELEKLIANKVPGSVYDPFTQKRLGARGYVEDAFRAMEAYTKRATRKANFDPALEQLSSKADNLDISGWNYVKRYGDRINMRPMEIDNLLDAAIKQSPVGYKLGARPVARASQAIRQATYRASLGLNIGSAVRNLTQGINTFSELGSHWTGVGYVKALRAIAERDPELAKVGVLDNSFVEDRTVSAFKAGLQKADKGLFAFFEAAEKVNRGAAYFGAKAKALKAGQSLDQAVQSGIDAARKTQFTFGRVDTPVALQGDIVKLLTQFQSYNVKQIEFLGEMVKNQEYAKLLRFTAASAVVYLTVGRALGYKPSDMLPSPQIGGAPPFKVPAAVGNAIVKTFTAKDNNSTTRTKQVEKAWMAAGSALGSTVVPGFSQTKKTVTGVKAVQRGEVKQGNKTLTVAQTPRNYVKAALFGPYSLHGTTKPGSVTSQIKGAPKGSSKSVKSQTASAAQPTKGIYQVKGKDGSTKFATLQGKNYRTYDNLAAAKEAQAKNEFKYSKQTTTTINGQQYHKTATGTVQKGAPPAPKAPTTSNTTYDPKTKTWTRVTPLTGKTVQIAADGTQTTLNQGIGRISNARPDYTNNIVTLSKKYGVDPYAALSVAAMEGLGGGVGDGGTSFGPFQLHVGGALPKGKDQAWAESPAGIDYALQQISKVAKGKTGPEAIQAIVSAFERPANPGNEIAGALAVYGGKSASLSAGSPRSVKIASTKTAKNTYRTASAKLPTTRTIKTPNFKVAKAKSSFKVPKQSTYKVAKLKTPHLNKLLHIA